MAVEIPQLKDTQPVISPVNINSAASGHEAFAKTLGALAERSTEEAKEMASDQSQTMYINSVANAEQIKTGAQMQMLEHPDQSMKIAERSAETLDMIGQASFVNKKDRTKLNSYLSGTRDDIALKATVTNVHQRQLESAYTHYANWPQQLQAYQQALLTDHDKAERLKEAMIASLHGLVSTGSITPIQAANSIKTMGDVVGIAHDHQAMYGNPETTARDYHTVTSHPLNNEIDNPDAPINMSTNWLMDYYNNDKSFQGVLSSINNRRLPNPQAFDSLTPDKRQHAILAMQGAQVADGIINSGESFASIEKTYQSLSESGRVLSYKDQATKQALSTYIQELKNGNFLNVMSQTPAGSAIMRDFNMRNSAIINTPIDDAQKNQLLIENKNNLVSSSIAYADAHHIPREYVQPIPRADAAIAQQAFNIGQDPSQLLTVLGHYSKENQAYLANAMKNPNQRMVVASASLAGNEIPHQDLLDHIAANQTGRNYISENVEGLIPNKTLMTRIYANLKEPMNIISQTYDAEQAQQLQTAMMQTTLNTAKYLAQKDHNITMEDKSGWLSKIFSVGDSSWQQYVDQASKIYKTSFGQRSGSNWVVNPKQLPTDLSDNQLDVLADYAISNGNDYLQSHLGDERYNLMRGRGALKMIITPTNDIQAVNANGDVAFSIPYNENLLAHAVEERKKKESKRIAETKRVVGEANESAAKRQLHIREPKEKGLLEKGNVDLNNRPRVENKNGTYSTVKTITVEENGKTVLLPTIVGGKELSNKEAIDHYRKTGQHMGKFSSEKEANDYDERLHKDKGWNGKSNNWK